MKLHEAEMTEKKAAEILSWRYEKPYDFYNNEDTAEGRAELLNGFYHTVDNDDNELIGFFCTGTSAQVPIGREYGLYEQRCIDMGLGMHPTLTGKGRGISFCTYILKEIEAQHPELPVRLTVAAFNKRAIHLYEKLGFMKVEEFSTSTADFDIMIRNRDGMPKS